MSEQDAIRRFMKLYHKIQIGIFEPIVCISVKNKFCCFFTPVKYKDGKLYFYIKFPQKVSKMPVRETKICLFRLK